MISLKVFDVLDKIRDEAGITASKWAQTAGYGSARITELRNLGILKNQNKTRKIGAEWSYEKSSRLTKALKHLMGKEDFVKSLKGKLRNMDLEDRLILKILALSDDEQARLEQIVDALKPELK